ncbi:MAG: glycosyltransferase 87 family protein, partial [Bryobacteraceae bacterium]
HPPSILHFLRFLLWMSEHTGLPFQFWIRIPGILADVGTLWLLLRILGARLAERSVFIAVIVIAASPAIVMISGFHGNTDSVMIFFAMAAVYLAGYRDNAPAAGLAFGLAICIKIAPVVLAPVLFLSLPGVRKRIAFLSATAGTIAIAWSPFVFRQPSSILRQVFGYRSSYGLWGLSWLSRQLTDSWPALQWLDSAFRTAGAPLLMAAILALSIYMHRLARRPSLYAQAGMVFLLFFSATSGFAVQYLAWLTPWVAELGALPATLFVLTGSVFLLVVYNYWTLGMPWYLGIAYPWQHHQYFQALCWMSVLFLAFAAWHRIRGGKDLPVAFLPLGSPWFRGSAAVLAAAALLIYPAILHMRRDGLRLSPAYADDEVLAIQAGSYDELAAELLRRGRLSEAGAAENQAGLLESRANQVYDALVFAQPLRSRIYTPEEYIDSSSDAFTSGAFAECISDARESLRFRPGLPRAWYNISLCHASLHAWDAAIVAAAEALRFDPDPGIARQILQRLVAERSRRAASSDRIN